MKTLKQLLANMDPTEAQKVEAEETRLREALAVLSPEALALIDASKVSLVEAASHSMSRVHSHIQNREVGLISAHRGENSAEENNKRHHALGQDIKKAGFGFIPVKGQYVENHGTPQARVVSERSYMVMGKHPHQNTGLHKFLMKHGEKYNQDGIMHKAHDSDRGIEHSTKGESKGQTTDRGTFHANKLAMYHTQLKGAKKDFSFESYFYVNDRTFSSRQERLFG